MCLLCRSLPPATAARSLVRLVAMICLSFAIPTRLAGQQTATVHGTIRDLQTDSAVAGVTVLLVGTALVTTSDAAGQFRLSGVPPGRYVIRAITPRYLSDTVGTGDLTPGSERDVVLRLRRTPLQLDAVVVTVDRAPRAASDASVSVEVLPQREIMNRDVTYLEDALPYVAGVTFNGGGQLDIRGSTGTAQGVGSRVLMLLDGHPVLSADGGEIIWESLPLLDVQQVEVVKSAFSAVYGSNALGGVVNIITSPIGDQPATVVRTHYDWYQLPQEFRYGASRLANEGVQLQHSRRIGDVGTRLEIGRESSDGFYQNGEYDRWFARARVTSTAESSHPWDAYAVYSRNRSGNFLAWRSNNEPFEVDSAYLGDRSVYDVVYTGGSITPMVTSSSVLKISPYVTYNANQDYFHTDRDYHHALRGGGSAQLNIRLDTSNALVAGTDGAYTSVHSNFLGTTGIGDFGIFAEDQLDVSKALALTAGGRYDEHETTRSASEASINPKLAVRYQLTDAVALRASIGRGYRAPSAIEQFVSAVQFGYRVIPNPELHGETGWSRELGVVATPWNGAQLDAALFLNTYHDLIGPSAAPDSIFVFQFRNVQEARIRGLDLGWRQAVLPNVADLHLTYLYLDAIDTQTDQWLPYRSRHNVTASLDLLGGLAGVDVRYRSRVESVLVYPLDSRSDITVVDLRANLPVIHGTVLQAKVSNLFNRFYTDVQERTPGAPRSVSLGLLANF